MCTILMSYSDKEYKEKYLERYGQIFIQQLYYFLKYNFMHIWVHRCNTILIINDKIGLQSSYLFMNMKGKRNVSLRNSLFFTTY